MSSPGAPASIRYDSPEAMDPPPGTSWALVLDHVPAGARVLDVGCSTGSFAVAMKRKGCHVTGVEIDPAAAEVARTRADAVHVGDVATLVGDGTLPTAAFDVIVAADVLEHLVDPWAVVRTFRRLLRPSGIVVASLPNVTHAAVVLELCHGRFPLRPEGLLDQTHLRFFGEESALDLFRDTGYQAEVVGRTRMDPRNTEFATSLDDVPDAVLAFLDRNPNADTYQFIIRAAPGEAAAATVGRPSAAAPPATPIQSRLGAEVAELRSQLRTYHEAALERMRALETMQGQLAAHHEAAVARVEEMRELHARLGTYHEELTAAQATLATREAALTRAGERLAHERARRAGRERSMRALAGRYASPDVLRVLYVADRTDAPFRYRCQHGVEQLRDAGCVANAMHLGDPQLLDQVASYSVVVLFRLPWSDRVAALVERARQTGATLVFESDDLVFDLDAEPLLPFLGDFPEALRRDYHARLALTAQTFEACDAFVGSTPALARHAERLGTPGLVHPNLVSPAYVRDARLLRVLRRFVDRTPAIAYLSGSNTHDRDLASIAGALATVLERHRDTRLLLCGFMHPPPALDAFRDRTVHLAYQDWRAYPWALARCRVALAPAAIVNEFSNAKSALKFFEAGIFGIPTVATPTEAFREAIVDGENGFLATTDAEWTEKIGLALDRARSHALGARARRTTLARYAFRAHRRRLRDLLLPLAGAASGPPPVPLPADIGEHGRPPSRAGRATRRRTLRARKLQLLRNRAPSEETGAAMWHDALEAAALDPRALAAGAAALPPGTSWFPGGDLERGPDGTWTATGADPILASPPIDLKTADFGVVVVRMRLQCAETHPTAQFFWRPADAPGFSEAHSVCWPVQADGEMRTYVLDLTQTRWCATPRVTALRLDPLAAPGTIEIESIALLPASAPRIE